MKKLIIILSFLAIFLPAKLQVVNIYSNDGTINNIMADIDSIFLILPTYETSDRTIDVGPEETYTTIYDALASTGDVWVNCTLTISLASGSYDWTQACNDEIQTRIEATNSALQIVSATTTTILDAVSLSKTASRLFAYTMTKTGTYTENQLRNYWMTNATQTEYYPICHNAAGTDAIEVEFTHNSKAALTRIIDFDATVTNATTFDNWLDVDFRINVNSKIIFKQLNLNSTNSYTYSFTSARTPKYFINTKMSGKRILFSPGDDIYQGTGIYLDACQVINTATGDNAVMTLAESPALTCYFRRCLFQANTGSITYGVLEIKGRAQKFVSGNYFYGQPNYAIFYFPGTMGEISYKTGIVCRDARSFIYFTNGVRVLPFNTAVTHEFFNVSNLFGNLPMFGSIVDISTINGSLPAGLFYGISSGYKLVVPSENICLHVTGLYPEQEKAVITLADNSSGTIVIGNTAQNKAVRVDYILTRGTSYEQGTIYLTAKAGTDIVDNDEFDDTGVTFTKSISSNDINLNWATTSTGNSAVLKYEVSRIMQ